MSQNASKNKQKKKEPKKDKKLFAQLFIPAQVRIGDVQELLQHETRQEPSSLPKEGEIYSGNKAGLLPCLKGDIEFPTPEPVFFFHAFTGYNQVFYFNMCKKKVAWKIWKSYLEVADKFINLGNLPLKESIDLGFPIIELFIALMYKRTITAITVYETRREMFMKDGRDLETIPPTSAALHK